MAFSWGNLISTAARSRAGMLEQGRLGEQERAEREANERAAVFAEYAKRRQLEQEDRQLKQQGDIAAERLKSAAELLAAKNENARLIAERNNQTRTGIAGMQYGPEGSVDRTNTSREGIADKNNQGALQRVQITVDGANRRDNNIVRLPDGSFGVSDATGRISPLGGTPYNNPTGTDPNKAPKGKQLTAGERGKLITANRAVKELDLALSDISAANAKGIKYAGGIDANMLRAKTALQGSSPDVMAAQRAAAAWSRISSKETNALFGAALSGREDARIQYYLPRLSSTNEKVVEDAVRNMKRILEETRDDMLDTYERDQFDISAYRPQAGAAPPPPPAGTAPGTRRPIRDLNKP